jgi:hypothetical protein
MTLNGTKPDFHGLHVGSFDMELQRDMSVRLLMSVGPSMREPFVGLPHRLPQNTLTCFEGRDVFR